MDRASSEGVPAGAVAWGTAAGLGLIALTGGEALMWGDGDPAMHVALGRAIAAARAIPATDPFLVGAPAFHDHEWLFDVLAAGLWHLGGPALLGVAVAALFAATSGELARQVATRAGMLAGAPALMLALSCAPMHLQIRPHLFTWAFLVLGRRLLERRPPVWAWALLGIAWANLHGGFLPGLFLLGALGGWRPAAGIALGSLVNPAGFALHWSILAFLTDRAVLDRTQDFLPAMPENPGFARFLVLGLAILAAVWAAHAGRWSRAGARDAGWAVGLVVLAASSVRNVPLVALLVAPDVARWLQSAVDRWRDSDAGVAIARVEARFGAYARRGAVAAVLAGSAVALRLPGGPEGAGVPVAGLRALPDDAVLFATFHWGGWSALLRPTLKLAAHPLTANYDAAGARMEEYARVSSASPGWAAALDAREVTHAWLDPRLPLVGALEAAGWTVLHRDASSVALERGRR